MTPTTVDLPDTPLTLADLTALGVSSAAVRALVATGALRRVLRGVYVRGDLPDTLELRARCLARILPGHAVICDRTAAWLWGIDCLAPGEKATPPKVEVVSVAGHDRTRVEGSLGGKRDLVEHEICEIGGVRVTTPVRTACDLASLRGRGSALAVYDAFARQFGLTAADFARQLERFAGRRGVKQARELAAYAIAGAESPGESWTRMAIIDAQLRIPTAQVWVTLPDGRRVRLDLAYEDVCVAVEYDGEEFHSTDADRRADRLRRTALEELGWIVIVVTKDDLAGERLDRWTLELRTALRERHTSYIRRYSRGESYRGRRR